GRGAGVLRAPIPPEPGAGRRRSGLRGGGGGSGGRFSDGSGTPRRGGSGRGAHRRLRSPTGASLGRRQPPPTRRTDRTPRRASDTTSPIAAPRRALTGPLPSVAAGTPFDYTESAPRASGQRSAAPIRRRSDAVLIRPGSLQDGAATLRLVDPRVLRLVPRLRR